MQSSLEKEKDKKEIRREGKDRQEEEGRQRPLFELSGIKLM